MKYIPSIVAGLLGALFVFAGAAMLFHWIEAPPPPADTPAGQMMAAFGPTGYMTFVKVLELLGGILVAIPKTRRLGLLVLGPIIVNILAFHIFIMRGALLLDPMLIFAVIAALYLLWVERKAFGALLR
jgi:putative oxidoreductase